MSPLKSICAIAACAICVGSTANSQESTGYSPQQIRDFAVDADRTGNSERAYLLAETLLLRDPKDVQALVLKSRAARNLGQLEIAVDAARSAWRAANTPVQKHFAALAMAQALSSSGRRTPAQFWLRRAVELAPNDALKLRAARDFQYVRRQNPWALSLGFSLAPSSNINNGSRNETSELFDLPFEFQLGGEARALSGVEIATGIGARYRLTDTDRKRSDLHVGVSHTTYVLSDDARDIAPDAEGADFATTSIFAAVQETYALPNPKARLGWNLRLGATWYAGEELFRYVRAGASYQHVVGDRGIVDFSLSGEKQAGLNGREDATIWSGRLGYGVKLGSGNRLSVSAGLTEAQSDADYLDYTRREIAAHYSLAKPVGPAVIDFGLSFADKRHDLSALTSNGRQERTATASVTAALPKLDYYGFIPTITVEAERTDANLDLYETESFGIQLGIRSAF